MGSLPGYLAHFGRTESVPMPQGPSVGSWGIGLSLVPWRVQAVRIVIGAALATLAWTNFGTQQKQRGICFFFPRHNPHRAGNNSRPAVT